MPEAESRKQEAEATVGWSDGTSNNQHQARGPSQFHRHELLSALQVADEQWHFRGVPVRPIGLRQKIIDDVDPAWTKQCERLVEMGELARPRIRINQIELLRCRVPKKVRTIHHVKSNATITREVSLRGGDERFVGIHRVEL